MRLVLAALLLAATPVAAMTASLPAFAQEARSPALAKIFRDSDEEQLTRNPLGAIGRGDLRYADRFGDFLSDASIAANRAAAEHDLAALNAIDRARLSRADRVSYDVFKYQTLDTLEGLRPAIIAATIVRPIDHFFGFHTSFPDFSSGEGVAPFKTMADYENGLKRIDGFVKQMDLAIARFREGEASGVTQPVLVVDNVIGQLDALIAQGVDKSPFMGPTRKYPANMSAADEARLTAAYAAAVRDKIDPAYTRLRDFLKTEYRPHARTSVGLGQMPGGAALYAYLVRSTTTTDMTPATIHALGLSEVARIKAGMDAIRKQVGFKGTLAEFFVYLRKDPKFAPTSAQAFGDDFRRIKAKVETALPRLFVLVPKSPLEIRPVPDYVAKNQAGAYYNGGTPDGSRPGVFYYNTYDLPSRQTFTEETLFLHEGEPGHHFQISVAQENTGLPAFQRFGGNTAYVEGWALYAESLGGELGLYTDPYQKFGNLNDEMLRAMRLVVDTGIHSEGWTRDRAIQYMLDNSAMGRTDATAEVERYIAIPSQALAYKVGALTIRRLRTKAEHELGPKFDVRQFHARVLDDGALPMAVLEKKVDDWIAATR
jgi:uncharacterized protein (DUF885 family)